MKILILGAGRVGSSLASTLSREEYEVSIVDLNKDKLLKLQEEFDLATEIGHGSHPLTLEKAGADKDTILLAVTNSDECNIISCQIAKSKFNVKKTRPIYHSPIYCSPRSFGFWICFNIFNC